MRQIFGEIGWEKKALVFFAGIVILTVLGPFGTYEDLGFWARLVFWTMIMGGVGFFMHVGATVSLGTRALGQLNRFARLAVGSVIAAVPGTAVVMFVNQVFRPSTTSFEAFPYIWMQVALIGFVICCVEYVDWGLRASHTPPPVKTTFHNRLEPDLGSDIISLSMQDHYVEVTTTLGRQMMLMRLSDAISELSGLDGVQVHRSHWVAIAHVRDFEKLGHRAFLTTSDARQLPVSETYSAAVRALAQA